MDARLEQVEDELRRHRPEELHSAVPPSVAAGRRQPPVEAGTNPELAAELTSKPLFEFRKSASTVHGVDEGDIAYDKFTTSVSA